MGKDLHTSVLGGILTLMVQALTASLMLGALREMFLMENPKIHNYAKPLSKEERAELVPLSLEDYNYVLAFKTDNYSYKSSQFEGAPIPLEVGRIKAWANDGPNWIDLPLEKCSAVLDSHTMEHSNTDSGQWGDNDHTYCVKLNKDLLVGSFFDDIGSSPHRILFSFEECFRQ